MFYLKTKIECQVFRRGIPWLQTASALALNVQKMKTERILMNRLQVKKLTNF